MMDTTDIVIVGIVVLLVVLYFIRNYANQFGSISVTGWNSMSNSNVGAAASSAVASNSSNQDTAVSLPRSDKYG